MFRRVLFFLLLSFVHVHAQSSSSSGVLCQSISNSTLAVPQYDALFAAAVEVLQGSGSFPGLTALNSPLLPYFTVPTGGPLYLLPEQRAANLATLTGSLLRCNLPSTVPVVFRPIAGLQYLVTYSDYLLLENQLIAIFIRQAQGRMSNDEIRATVQIYFKSVLLCASPFAGTLLGKTNIYLTSLCNDPLTCPLALGAQAGCIVEQTALQVATASQTARNSSESSHSSQLIQLETIAEELQSVKSTISRLEMAGIATVTLIVLFMVFGCLASICAWLGRGKAI